MVFFLLPLHECLDVASVLCRNHFTQWKFVFDKDFLVIIYARLPQLSNR